MKTKELLKNIQGVFKPPVKKYYFGKLRHGTPYFYPMHFNSNIISIRRLKLKTEEEINKYFETYPHLLKYRMEYRFSNLPMVRRNKNWTFELFNQWWHIQIGWPFSIYSNELGWKDKFESPRFEWVPAFYIFLFRWQFCIWWTAPDGDNDKYYEMILQYLYYQDKNIEKARSEWEWTDMRGKSTWNDEYIIKHFN